ncbi:SusC/RagA family TonB-linked outer membrane protein [Chitinophaga sp. 212800010-3]|uniref:SusC/RagA family TonB-linked outer membrane protein n=1 Tax=Bacteroidota TaxID=976 RepID=UPI001AD208F1|nr:SusC/RagA family TonB-linked outer membrane protein [Chitinophaga sp. 212800010-3]MBN8880600.1 SusC/RagA family TonB-linked outer membrane protein [Sphingobacteriales bacterium]MBN9484361.1 SusC/RagA family TonB-linked outer membrane protein [Bacteroidota bacterium]MEC5143549.1 SusC/RagA family TonB-linked outer membrane protein [Chitinophaga sp. 212800010-3]
MKFFIPLITLLIISGTLYAQRQIMGKVISRNDNMPIEGASISLQGTNTTVSTDGRGYFTIQTANGNIAVLTISHVGYEPSMLTVNLPQTDTLKIRLNASSRLLDEVEVVSTGYQKIPKERATGSFATVSNELFNQQVGTDILSRLPAIANSMVMDAGRSQYSSQMMIRGLSTINGQKDPLIIIDNFPYDGDITNINPNIVENITILKDASASSIWGARAANGVIVITTKSGRFNQPITLSFNSNLTIGAKPDLGYIRQMSSSDYIDMEQELFNRNFYNSQINSSSRPVISPVVDLLNKVRTGAMTQEQAQQQIDAFRNVDARAQFNEYMYKPLVNQQYFLSAQGGADKFSWTSSVGYDHNKSNLEATYQRVNIRFQNTYRPIKQLSLTTGLYYSQTQNKSGRYGYNNVSMKSSAFVPYMLMADANGNALPVAKNYNQSYVQNLGDGKLLDWNYYPLTDWQHQTSNSNVSDVLATANLEYRIIKGLNATVNYQYERQFGLSTNLADENSFMARDYINRFSQIVNGSVIYIVPNGDILDKTNSVLNANNLRGQLNFDNTYGKHNITALIGGEKRSAHTQSNQERYYGYNPNNLTTGNVDYTNTYPSIINGGADYIQRGQYLGETSTRFMSYFANAAYTFDNRYVISASARRDASNLFGLKTNDQWNPFWSAGIAWKLSNEKFYKVDFLPYLNLRATYGFSGNIDPAMVAVNTIRFLPNTSFFTGTPYASFNNYYNPLLKWETSKMLNLAVDFRLRNERLTGSIEYYHKKGINLFGMAPMDYTTGVDPYMLRNVASMKGNGWDIQLRSVNIDRSFKWSTILNFSLYKDEIVDYYLERTLAQEYVNVSSPPISGVNGKPVYAIYAYQWAGLDPNTGEAQGYLNGEVSKDYYSIIGTETKVEDLKYFGSAIPTKFGSLINAVSYKNISLQLGVSFKFGYWFRRNSINYTDLFNSWRGHSDYALRWLKPGDEAYTDVPVNQYRTNYNRDAFYSGSSVLVEKGDHIRLQYINLAYDFKLSAKGIKGLQLFFNANNLGILWKANNAGIDPDFSLGYNILKTPANYSLGLKAKL